MLDNTTANHLFGIAPEAFGAVGAMLNFASAIIISKMTAEPPEHIQHLVEDIRVPKGASGAVDH
jgi:cation/acetate symporter